MDFDKTAAQNSLHFWEGHRHLDRRAEAGKGIDCIHLVLEALISSGAITRDRLPTYSIKWGLMTPENLMAEGLTRLWHAERIQDTSTVQWGDIVIWKAGTQSNHCGFVAHPSQAGATDLAVWHVMKGGKVHSSPLGPVLRRCQELVRLVKPGWQCNPAELNLATL